MNHALPPAHCPRPPFAGTFPADVAVAVELSTASVKLLTVTARKTNGSGKTFRAIVRIDTPQEVLYYQHGGILQYVLRQLLGQK